MMDGATDVREPAEAEQPNRPPDLTAEQLTKQTGLLLGLIDLVVKDGDNFDVGVHGCSVEQFDSYSQLAEALGLRVDHKEMDSTVWVNIYAGADRKLTLFKHSAATWASC